MKIRNDYPKCNSESAVFSKKHSMNKCEDFGHEFAAERPFAPLRLFLNYGNGSNEKLVRRIKSESEHELRLPVNMGQIQWPHIQDWKERRDAGESAWEQCYQAKLADIVQLEGDESRSFAGELETLKGHLKPIKPELRIRQLLGKGYY